MSPVLTHGLCSSTRTVTGHIRSPPHTRKTRRVASEGPGVKGASEVGNGIRLPHPCAPTSVGVTMARADHTTKNDAWPRLPTVRPGGSTGVLAEGFIIGAVTVYFAATSISWLAAVAFGVFAAALTTIRWRRTRRIEIIARPLPSAPGDRPQPAPARRVVADPGARSASTDSLVEGPASEPACLLERPSTPTAPKPPTAPRGFGET